MNRFLAIVCILKEDNFHSKGLIDYNFLCLRKAIPRVFQVRANRRRQTAGSGTGDVVAGEIGASLEEWEVDKIAKLRFPYLNSAKLISINKAKERNLVWLVIKNE